MDKVARQTLAWINEQRAELEIGPPLENLPLGRPRSSHFCPIAHALGPANATASYVSVWRNGRRHILLVPEFASAFIKRFDHGDYPQLVE